MRYALTALLFITLFFSFGCARFQTKKTTDLVQGSKFINKTDSTENYTESVYFEVYSYALNISGEDALTKIAQLQAVLEREIYLSGHADKTGNKQLNVVLSRQRAESAKEYLLRLGIKEEFIHMQYFGDSVPAVDEDTLEAYAKNRRVEIELKTNKRDTK
ncbi:MAG: OmpA family protein [Endomicrobia bacterium]|nr:OmpA family protein [Endomicrobiia bacterium]